MTILVTGGAGYIGSHTVRMLRDRGRDVVVLDTLELGHRHSADGRPQVELQCTQRVSSITLRAVFPSSPIPLTGSANRQAILNGCSRRELTGAELATQALDFRSSSGQGDLWVWPKASGLSSTIDAVMPPPDPGAA
jgi:NAD(P)-dependent dehydrogenase (short-subunit alcohol dehydrogenase family)